MMAMSLYGSGSGGGGSGDRRHADDYDGLVEGLGVSLEVKATLVNKHPRLPTNDLELRGARSLRPRRRRKKRSPEVSLYPTVAAIEAAAPEAVIAEDDHGRFEILLKEEEEREGVSDASSSVNIGSNENDSPLGHDKALKQVSLLSPQRDVTGQETDDYLLLHEIDMHKMARHSKQTKKLNSSRTVNSASAECNIASDSPFQQASHSDFATRSILSSTATHGKPSTKHDQKKEGKEDSLLHLPRMAWSQSLDDSSSICSSGSAQLAREFRRVHVAAKRKSGLFDASGSRKTSRQSMIDDDDACSWSSSGTNTSALIGSLRETHVNNEARRNMSVEEDVVPSLPDPYHRHDSDLDSSNHLRSKASLAFGNSVTGNARSISSKRESLGYQSSRRSGKCKSIATDTAVNGGLNSHSPSSHYASQSMESTNRQASFPSQKNTSPVSCLYQDFVEISPGVSLPLRSVEETMAAMKTGFVEELFCPSCETELICLADVSHCVCPECQYICPVNGIASFTGSTSRASGSLGCQPNTVGLGIRAAASSSSLATSPCVSKKQCSRTIAANAAG